MNTTEKEFPAKVIRRSTAFGRQCELVITDPTGEEFNELHFHLFFNRMFIADAEEIKEGGEP